MEVILKEDVIKLGRRGDKVAVAEGYGRNYLLPRRLAIEATPANLRNLEQMRAAAARQSAKDLESAQRQAQQLAALHLAFQRRAGEHGTLFGSVTSMDIAAELERHGFQLDRRRLHLPEPLKTTGKFKVPVQLHHDVTVELQVEIEAEKPAEDGE